MNGSYVVRGALYGAAVQLVGRWSILFALSMSVEIILLINLNTIYNYLTDGNRVAALIDQARTTKAMRVDSYIPLGLPSQGVKNASMTFTNTSARYVHNVSFWCSWQVKTVDDYERETEEDTGNGSNWAFGEFAPGKTYTVQVIFKKYLSGGTPNRCNAYYDSIDLSKSLRGVR